VRGAHRHALITADTFVSASELPPGNSEAVFFQPRVSPWAREGLVIILLCKIIARPCILDCSGKPGFFVMRDLQRKSLMTKKYARIFKKPMISIVFW
jgi:hypothetical protein